MPPAGAAQPADAERQALHALLSDSIDNFDYSTVDNPGYEPVKTADAPRARQHPARPRRREFHRHRPFPGRAGRRERLRQHRQHAVPRIDTDGAVYRGGRAGRRVDAAARNRRPLRSGARTSWCSSPRPAAASATRRRPSWSLRHFLGRAWRRPPGEQDVARVLGQYRTARRSGLDFEESVKVILQAVLISPKFLLRVETPPRSRSSGTLPHQRLGPRPRASPISCGPRCRTPSCATSPGAASCAIRPCSKHRWTGCWRIRRPTPSAPASPPSGSASSTSAPGSGSTPSTIRGAPTR